MPITSKNAPVKRRLCAVTWTDVTYVSRRVPEECCQATADLLASCVAETPAERPTAAEIILALSDILGLPRAIAGEGGSILSSTLDHEDMASYAPISLRPSVLPPSLLPSPTAVLCISEPVLLLDFA